MNQTAYPAPPTLSTMWHGTAPTPHVIQQIVHDPATPSRLKSNAEWVAEASAVAQRAADAVLKQATIERLNALHSQVLGHLFQGTEVPVELLEEYGTLVGV